MATDKINPIKTSNILLQLQSGTDRTLVVTWEWSKKNTKEYKVQWQYHTGNKNASGGLIWIVGEDTTTTRKVATYDAPSNAKYVRVKIKPIAENDKKKKPYWTTDWSSFDDRTKHSFSKDAPETPSAPSVSVSQYQLTAEISIYDSRAKNIEFQIVQDNSKTFASQEVDVSKNYASFTCTIAAGHEYKARCRAINGTEKSSWSEYSGGSSSVPSVPTGFTISVRSSTEVQLNWEKVTGATSYVVEYTKDKVWFTSSPSNVQSVTVPGKWAEISGLDSGETWWFRIQAVNETGSSKFCTEQSVVLGKKPTAPTTWSLKSTVSVGEDAVLYWVHNSEDSSKQTGAEIKLSINGVEQPVIPISTSHEGEEPGEKEQTYSYSYSTSSMTSGAEILWQVRTKGITNEFGEWSIQRSIKIYAPASLTFSTVVPSTLTSYPLPVHVLAFPSEQTALRFFVSITANESYEVTELDGTSKWISKGEEIFSKNYYCSNNTLSLDLTPSDVSFGNNISYTLKVTASMDSGMHPEITANFTFVLADSDFYPYLILSYTQSDASMGITAYCESDETPLSDLTLSVYRKEFDGSFVLIADNLLADGSEDVKDPHPSLDSARYRVVAISNQTGQIEYSDSLYDEIDEPAVIIQWDEPWSYYNSELDDEDNPSKVGSLLRLPYNVDISDTYSPDTSLVEYIGRSHPVSYYGTQKGVTTTWNVDIDREDMETLYALRRLAVYPGDVYVREPSGSSYWANVKVSFSSKHCDVIIPVTLNITRVEGGK